VTRFSFEAHGLIDLQSALRVYVQLADDEGNC
jgi:hypothetical protein